MPLVLVAGWLGVAVIKSLSGVRDFRITRTDGENVTCFPLRQVTVSDAVAFVASLNRMFVHSTYTLNR